jgi:predicted RNA-binding Zn-ribbon protein involved in translation (DUF1610 family)
MATTTKVCPKCSTEMSWAQNVLIIPAANHPSSVNDPVSTRTGFPVAAFCCPDCNYVELYRQEMRA